MSKALFGAGCFWGPEKKFSEIKGVIETQVGYSQGLTDKTSYEEVCKGNTYENHTGKNYCCKYISIDEILKEDYFI